MNLHDAREHVWRSLGRSPVRRSVLGRERCDALVRIALEKCESRAASGVVAPAVLAAAIEDDVRREIDGRAGFAIWAIILGWAISAVVQALVTYWLENRT